MNNGSTLLDPDELQGLKISVSTRKGLDDAEFANIMRGLMWVGEDTRSAEEMLTIGYLCDLHRHMFSDIWKWAGNFRRSDKNIGIHWPYIPEQLQNIMEDVKTWIKFRTFPSEEISVRLHHRLVKVHPFVNGNGRITRILATLVNEKLGCKPLQWSGLSLATIQNTKKLRGEYLKALNLADRGEYAQLIKFGTRGFDERDDDTLNEREEGPRL